MREEAKKTQMDYDKHKKKRNSRCTAVLLLGWWLMMEWNTEKHGKTEMSSWKAGDCAEKGLGAARDAPFISTYPMAITGQGVEVGVFSYCSYWR